MSDPKSRLSTRVEVFTRATADALNRAIGEVLDARSPWQLLYRLSRIVFLGLVLYLGWILVVVQPDLARRLMLPPAPPFRERFALHRDPVEEVLEAAVAAPGFGLHALVVAEWDGAGSLRVLAAQGRTPQLPLEPGDDVLLGVAMARVMGHVALGLCDGERPVALGLDASELPASNITLRSRSVRQFEQEVLEHMVLPGKRLQTSYVPDLPEGCSLLLPYEFRIQRMSH